MNGRTISTTHSIEISQVTLLNREFRCLLYIFKMRDVYALSSYCSAKRRNRVLKIFRLPSPSVFAIFQGFIQNSRIVLLCKMKIKKIKRRKEKRKHSTAATLKAGKCVYKRVQG